jgi:hypothetical protein
MLLFSRLYGLAREGILDLGWRKLSTFDTP